MIETKKNVGGRPPKINPAKNRITINLSDTEYVNFLTMFERSGEISKAAFVKARLFNKSFKVVTVDGGALKFCQQLTAFYNQFQAVARNYNQIVVILRNNFEEQKAMTMLYSLEKETSKMVQIYREVIGLVEDFRGKYGSKN